MFNDTNHKAGGWVLALKGIIHTCARRHPECGFSWTRFQGPFSRSSGPFTFFLQLPHLLKRVSESGMSCQK